MPIPEFVVNLRAKIGHDLLWMPGVTAVVLRPAPEQPNRQQVLLIQRSDNHEWTPVTGIVDPGEDPHVTAVREVLEEACVEAEVERLVWVWAGKEHTHLNGDRAVYLDHTFRCQWVAGEPRPGDDEAVDAAWYFVDDLPAMRETFIERIHLAVAADQPQDVRLGR